MRPGGKGSRWVRWDQLACPKRLTAASATERHSDLGCKSNTTQEHQQALLKRRHMKLKCVVYIVESFKYVHVTWYHPHQPKTYLFFIFFFLGESSSEPFLPLPLEPRFSLMPRDSPSVENIKNIPMHISPPCSFYLFFTIEAFQRLRILFTPLPSALS